MYVESLEGVSNNFARTLSDLKNLKHTLAFLVDPFDVVKDRCPVHKPVVTQAANIEAQLLDRQHDVALKSVHQSQLTVEFWKQVSIDKYPAHRQTSQRQSPDVASIAVTGRLNLLCCIL